MANTVRTPSFPRTKQSNLKKVLWEGLDGDDTGLPVRIGKYTDKTVHVFSPTAAFGGATVTFEGSNDPRANPTHADHANADWIGLTDGQGNAITTTGSKIEVIQENPEWIRPKSAGGTAANISVGLTAKRTP